jgi:hypothetical protein
VVRRRIVSVTAAIATEGWTESSLLAIHLRDTFCEIRHYEKETNGPEGYKEMQDNSEFKVTRNHVELRNSLGQVCNEMRQLQRKRVLLLSSLLQFSQADVAFRL